MTEDLDNEIEAINSIYGDLTLTAVEADEAYVLTIPNLETSLRISFPPDYPNAPPSVLGTHSSGDHTRKGEAAHILDVFRDAVGRVWQPGEVCLFDVIEDISTNLPAAKDELESEVHDLESSFTSTSISEPESSRDAPPWIISDVVVEMKSVFVARVAEVTSPDQARQFLNHLLNTDKKVAKATHNITAHRVKGENGVTYQDCDDDGETAAGGRLLHLMQLMDVWNVTCVVTRWYGGQKLGPARFGIINGVARDALVKGGYVNEEPANQAKKKGKK